MNSCKMNLVDFEVINKFKLLYFVHVRTRNIHNFRFLVVVVFFVS